MTNLPWVECPTYDVDCDLPIQQRYANAPEEVLSKGRRLLAAMQAEMPGNLRPLADMIRLRTANRFQKEAKAIAGAVGVDWRDLLIANVSYDLVLAAFGCSTIAVASPNGPVVARNMDWWPEQILAQCSCLMKHRSAGQLVFANAGWPGAIGAVTGLSGRGFAVVLNAVSHDDGISKLGYPVLLHIRRVLEDAKDFDDALKMLSTTRLAAPALLTLVGSENSQRVVIERTPTQHALRWADDGPLVTTNHYRLLNKPTVSSVSSGRTKETAEIYQTSCARYDYLTEFFASDTGDHSLEDTKLLYALTDDHVKQSITAQHIIMRPRTKDVKLFVPRHLME